MRISDWSSDVCSSDLGDRRVVRLARHPRVPTGEHPAGIVLPCPDVQAVERGQAVAVGAALVVEQLSLQHRRRRVVRVPGLGDHQVLDCDQRSEEHTSELQSLMRISYAVFCLKKKITRT